MSIFSRLFGGNKSSGGIEPEEYEGFLIYPEPIREGTKWRISARIEREVEGEMRSHRLIRADTLDDQEGAVSASVGKAKQMIDEQGTRLFE